MNPFTVIWRAPEFEFHPKGVSWYWASIIFSVLLITIGVWQKNFFFALFVIIAEILILVWAGREPKTLTFTLTEKGLAISDHNKFHPLREIASFASYEDWSDEWSVVIIDFKAHFHPSARIHLPRQRFTEIERAMRTVIPFVHRDESLVDVLERYFGF